MYQTRIKWLHRTLFCLATLLVKLSPERSRNLFQENTEDQEDQQLKAFEVKPGLNSLVDLLCFQAHLP